MKKTKNVLLSILVISAVFCITVLFNIQLPLHTAKGSDAMKETATTHYNVDQAEVFSVNQFLSHGEAQVSQEDAMAEEADTFASDAPTQGSPQSSVSPENTSDVDASVTDAPADNPDSATAEIPDNAVTPAVTEAPEEPPVVEEPKYADIGISIAKEYVNVRKEPTTDGKVLGKLYRDAACTIKSEKDGWYYVESGTVTGYIKAELIKTGIPDDELIAKYAKLKISVEVDGLNVRQEPSQDSKKLTCIYMNEKYSVLEKDGEWTKIHLDDENQDGYVKSEYTKEVVTFEDAISKAEEDEILAVQAEARAKAETVVKYGDGFSCSEEDFKLFVCLVHAEAGDQPYEGKLAVANIVLNRIKSSKYPDTLRDVIYQPGQFSVAQSGSLQKQLDNYDNFNSKSQLLTIKAVKEALEGANNIGNRLYFHTYEAAAKKGLNDNKNSVKIGDHLFW